MRTLASYHRRSPHDAVREGEVPSVLVICNGGVFSIIFFFFFLFLFLILFLFLFLFFLFSFTSFFLSLSHHFLISSSFSFSFSIFTLRILIHDTMLVMKTLKFKLGVVSCTPCVKLSYIMDCLAQVPRILVFNILVLVHFLFYPVSFLLLVLLLSLSSLLHFASPSFFFFSFSFLFLIVLLLFLQLLLCALILLMSRHLSR